MDRLKKNPPPHTQNIRPGEKGDKKALPCSRRLHLVSKTDLKLKKIEGWPVCVPLVPP